MRWRTERSSPGHPGRQPIPPLPTRAVPSPSLPTADGRGRYGWLRAAGRALRRIIGAPDYQAYLEHCRTAGHPPGLTEAQYLEEFFEAKGKGVRCC